MSPGRRNHIHVLAVVLGLCVGGCHRSTESKQRNEPAPSPAPTFCETIARENEEALKSLPQNLNTSEVRDALRAAVACTPTTQGGWGLVVGGLAFEAGESWGRWTLVHAAIANANANANATPPRARLSFTPDTTTTFGNGGPVERPAPRQNLTWSASTHSLPKPPTFFDFDGDGEPEALVIVETTETSESGLSFTVRRGRIWAAHADGIQLYAPARDLAFEAVHDVDHDGRPDLITNGPYAAFATVTCGSEDPYPVSGPPLLAHSVPGGGFSWSDPVATAFARASCAAPPAKPISVGAGAVDFKTSARNVACARLWGALSAGLTTEIARRCARKPTSPCPACDDRQLLETWARLPPPLNLSATPP